MNELRLTKKREKSNNDHWPLLFKPYDINKYSRSKSPIEITRNGTLVLIEVIKIFAIKLTKNDTKDKVFIKVVILEVLNVIPNDESNVIKEKLNAKSMDISSK